MFLDQLLLVVAAGALAMAGLRVASVGALSGARGAGSVIERVLVAATLSAAFVVCWTLALGLAGLSGSVVGLALGSLLAWVAARTLAVPDHPSLTRELLERWGSATRWQRGLALAVLGLALGAVVGVARRPGFGIDALSYHLADVEGWLHSGHAGAVQNFSYDFPVGYYPVTTEILLSWLMGVSRSFAPLAVFSPAIAALALLALWRLLAVLRVPRLAAAAALVALATLPAFASAINYDGPGTDLPAVAWLACTAALSAGAFRRPALLGPAVLAAGLGIGTKTTVAPLAVVSLLAGGWGARDGLRSARGWIASGVAGALLIGTPWYVRDTIVHGWPLWPFSAGPTGDPMPPTMKLFDESFLARPGATVSADTSLYLRWIAGGLGLIGGALAAPLLARTRDVLLAAALALAAVLAWGLAPYTGLSRVPLLAGLAVTTVRYLLPALGACIVAVSLAARDGSAVGRPLALAVLAGSGIASLIADRALGYPFVPSASYLVIGGLVGGALGALAPSGVGGAPRVATIGLPVALAVLGVTFLTWSAHNWLRREALYPDSNQPVLAFMLGQPGFASGSQPISFAPAVVATLAGEDLRHPVSLIGAREPCPKVRARLQDGWVIVRPKQHVPGITSGFDAAACLRGVRPVYDDGTTLVYRGTAS